MKAINRPTKMSASEIAAVRDARNGDKNALEEIIRLAEPFVYYNCLKYTGTEHEEDARDLTQETLLKVYSRLSSLEKDEKFFSWIMTITINTCKDYHKKKRDFELFSDTFERSVLEAYEEVEDPDVTSETTPEKKIDSDATRQIIRDMVSKLPEEQRTAISMMYFDHLTSREIAEKLAINENTVKYRIAAGKKKIEKRIEEYRARNR